MAEAKQASRPSEEAVRAKTGKGWKEWFHLLDAAGAARMSHKEIVAYLRAGYEIDAWWQQSVTVAYEQARGLRAKHQRPDGYEVGASKTIAVALSAVSQAWSDDAQRARWLGDAPLAVQRVTPEKSLRATWGEEGSRVQVNFSAKGETKSQVTVTHGRLADTEEATRMKEFWSARLEALKAQLGG